MGLEAGQGRGGGLLPDRHPSGELFFCNVFDASPKGDPRGMEYRILSLSRRPDRRNPHDDHAGTAVTVTPPVQGRATIRDKDIVISCIGQLIAALNTTGMAGIGPDVPDAVRARAPGQDGHVPAAHRTVAR